MHHHKAKPGLLLGFLTSLSLTAPLIALLHLGDQAFGTPFTPFQLFDWQTRLLPGNLLTASIDLLVQALTMLGLSVRDTAKAAELGLALAEFLGLGTLIGGLGFFFWRRTGRELRPASTGSALGAVLGGLAAWLSLGFGQPTGASVALDPLWVLILFTGWGFALGWSFERMAPGTFPAGRISEQADKPSVDRINRRQFLITLGGTSAVVTVVGAGLGEVLRRVETGSETAATIATPGSAAGGDLPPRPEALEPAPGTRAEYPPVEEHYRIDINLEPAEVEGESWELPITGMVDSPLTLTLEDFQDQRFGEPLELFVTLACISNRLGGDLIGTTQWTGVPVRRILEEVGIQPAAKYLWISAADGFYEILPVELAMADERVMLAYLWDGRPLPVKHGFPLRIYIPDRYGMKQPKWITAIKAIEFYKDGFWVERGWDKVAQMKATSVIDTVAVDALVERDGKQLIPIGGIAHAGARGISRVEVSVDEGPWQRAKLRTPLSDLTWVLWRFDWPFEAGRHTFAVRCYDGDGQRQILEPSPPHPDGATGLHEVSETL
jgi:DMSO/TMAO reductase YedYZ molybdopterin-dependent catalytic subunit